jgi:hypothetical protein
MTADLSEGTDGAATPECLLAGIGDGGQTVSYAIKVRTDPVQFMQIVKKESIGSYVMSQLSCVSPFTLLGLKDVFKSVLQSKFPPEAAHVKDAPVRVRAVLGPWARVTVARLRGVLRELGFSKIYPLCDVPEVMARLTGRHQAVIGQRYMALLGVLSQLYSQCLPLACACV